MRRIVMGLVVGGFFLAPHVARATVDPACILRAKNDYLQCKSDCQSTFRDDKFRCRNVQPACGNACLAGREACLEPYDQVLTDCINGCDSTLQQGKQDCASGCGCNVPGPSCTDNCCANDPMSCYNTCVDTKQVDAFVCRDNCRESFHNDATLQQNIKNCRNAFHVCVGQCPPAQ
jgi:hypothetical protein